jgi:ribosomal-protein-alanine N-acetyltransferase
MTPLFSLRLVELSDAEPMLDYLERNREYHAPWSPVPPPDFFTLEHQRARLRSSVARRETGTEFRFGIFDSNDPKYLIGHINLTAIERGVYQNGRFGYSVDGERRNSGVMTSALARAVRFAFDELDLHRVEANVIPRNIASRRVLEKCGFDLIGRSPRMLCIAGVWEDHDMFAKLVD